MFPMCSTFFAIAGVAPLWVVVRHTLWLLAILGSVTSTVFLGMVLVAGARYWLKSPRARARALATPPDELPGVTILKPVHGMEPRLEETLESFFRQAYSNFEIVFGARSVSDPALAIVEKLRGKYPGVPARIIIAGKPSWPNAKVYSLARMIASSENSYFVISDSDVLVGPDFLRNVVPPLLDANVGLVTCLYKGVPAGGLWSHLEALGNSVEMPAGVLVADMMEGMKFALGAAMAVRRDAVEAIGGVRETADFYSDDFVLGSRIADAGYRVILSHYKVAHVLAARSLRQTLSDQLRWMKSTRFSRPWGHVGAGLTYAVPFGLLALLLSWGHPRRMGVGLVLFLIALLNRAILATAVGWGIVGDLRCLWLCWLYPLRDLLGFGTWASSFVNNKFSWRGEPYQFGENGRITPAQRAIEFVGERLPQAHD